jgi:uncharacterized membrane protein YfcA
MLLAYFMYAFIGIFAGFLGGLLGIGGGSIAVPALLWTFSYLQFPQSHVMHIAIGTSLASMVINTLASAYFHQKKGAVHGMAIRKMIPGLLLGSLLGALTSPFLSGVFLQILFGLFTCAMSLYFVKPVKIEAVERHLPSLPLMSLQTGSISFMANILGIGGGIFTVPLLMHYSFKEKKAIGTSAAVSFIITLCGAIGYLIQGEDAFSQTLCVGYVYLPAFVIISVTSFFSAFYGAKLAHALPLKVLRTIFAAALLAVGLSMILS